MIIRLAQESLKQENLKEIADVKSYSAVKFAAAGVVVVCTLGTPRTGHKWSRIWDRLGLTRPFSPRLA